MELFVARDDGIREETKFGVLFRSVPRTDAILLVEFFKVSSRPERSTRSTRFLTGPEAAYETDARRHEATRGDARRRNGTRPANSKHLHRRRLFVETTQTTVNTTTHRDRLVRGTASRCPFSHGEATAAECWLVLTVEVPVLLLYPPRRIYYTRSTDTRAGLARAQYSAIPAVGVV